MDATVEIPGLVKRYAAGPTIGPIDFEAERAWAVPVTSQKIGTCASRMLPQCSHSDCFGVLWRNPLPQVFENGISGTLWQCASEALRTRLCVEWRNSKDSAIQRLATTPALRRFRRVVAGPVATTVRKSEIACDVAGIAATGSRKHGFGRVVEEHVATTAWIPWIPWIACVSDSRL